MTEKLQLKSEMVKPGIGLNQCPLADGQVAGMMGDVVQGQAVSHQLLTVTSGGDQAPSDLLPREIAKFGELLSFSSASPGRAGNDGRWSSVLGRDVTASFSRKMRIFPWFFLPCFTPSLTRKPPVLLNQLNKAQLFPFSFFLWVCLFVG